jgi:hypothetical protein
MNITNKTRRPISVPLPGGKKLFLGPGKTGQLTPKSAAHPPLQALVEAGDLELDDARAPTPTGSFDGAAAKPGSPARAANSNIRRTGDR